MLAYILRRILVIIPTMLIVSMLTFIIIHLPPGDFMTSMVSQAAQSGSAADEATMQALRHQYGLDQPVYVQYLTWMGGIILHGDFGYSFEWKKPVGELLLGRLGFTVLLSFLSMAVMWLIAIPIGIYSATHQYSPGDNALTFLGFIGLSIPDFLLGLIWLFVGTFVLNMHVGGLLRPEFEDAAWSLAKLGDLANHLTWPVIILAVGGTAQLIRIMRGNLLDILNQQYITTARAKGLDESVVINKYAVRVAINPLISVMGMQLPHLISGATILGIVLSLPTIGPLFLQALITQDMYLAGSFLLLLALLLIIGNLLADIALAWVDPRIRYE